MNIPLVDLKRQYTSLQKEIDAAINNVIADTAFILGEYTAKFEKNFAQYCNTTYCVGLNSGSDALFLSFLALEIQKGDEVITVPNTFFATTESLGHIGAKPVFVDVDSETHVIDVSKIEQAITEKTKVILPVHLYGQMANMSEIMKIAKKYNLKVIEDCAQAHGATQNGQRPGTFGDVGIFSFYPSKNLGAYGDAGCIVTNNKNIANFVTLYRDHGRVNKYKHIYEAYSSRMDGIQAAILNVKLKYLNSWIEKRQYIASRYTKELRNIVKTPIELIENSHAYHLYVIQTPERDRLQNFLAEQGIATGVHYPIPLHLQKAYGYLGYQAGSFPMAEKLANEVLSLPIFPEMTDEEISHVIDNIKKF